jgi:hypothetical protein
MTNSGIQKAEVVVDFGDCTYGRSGVTAGGFLVNRNCRGKPCNEIHIRLVHLAKELPGICREGFYVASLSFCINGVECERGFPASGKTGKNHQFTSGDF